MATTPPLAGAAAAAAAAPAAAAAATTAARAAADCDRRAADRAAAAAAAAAATAAAAAQNELDRAEQRLRRRRMEGDRHFGGAASLSPPPRGGRSHRGRPPVVEVPPGHSPTRRAGSPPPPAPLRHFWRRIYSVFASSSFISFADQNRLTHLCCCFPPWPELSAARAFAGATGREPRGMPLRLLLRMPAHLCRHGRVVVCDGAFLGCGIAVPSHGRPSLVCSIHLCRGRCACPCGQRACGWAALLGRHHMVYLVFLLQVPPAAAAVT